MEPRYVGYDKNSIIDRMRTHNSVRELILSLREKYQTFEASALSMGDMDAGTMIPLHNPPRKGAL